MTAVPVRCDGEVATVVGSSRSDDLVGTSGADVIAALGGDDRIDGRGGRDVMCGGPGRDQIHGGAGADRIFGGRDRIVRDHSTLVLGDSLWGGPGRDRINPGWDPRRTTADEAGLPDMLRFDTATRGVRVNVQDGVATGQGRDIFTNRHVGVVGSPFADRVSGWNGPDFVLTGRGPDRVRTYGGRDMVWLDFHPRSLLLGPYDRARDKARDTAATGDGWDHVVSAGGVDTVSGGDGPDTLEDHGHTVDVLAGDLGSDDIHHWMIFGKSGLVLDGGAGIDDQVWLTLPSRPEPEDSTSIDLRTGVLEHVPVDGPTVTHTMMGFEDGSLGDWGKLTLYGTEESNFLSFSANNASVFAFGGDDYLSTVSAIGSTFDGGDGFDRLVSADCALNTCISIEFFSP